MAALASAAARAPAKLRNQIGYGLSVRVLVLVPTLVLLLLACGAERPPALASAVEGLPPYTPAEAAVFDDSIALAVFGHREEREEPERDPKLIERTQRADTVVRVKVATATRDDLPGAVAYTLVMVAVDAPLAGREMQDPVEVRIEPTNPSLPLLRDAERALVGRTLVLFFRLYNDQGEPRVHFRAEPDTEPIRDAVVRAKALDEAGS